MSQKNPNQHLQHCRTQRNVGPKTLFTFAKQILDDQLDNVQWIDKIKLEQFGSSATQTSYLWSCMVVEMRSSGDVLSLPGLKNLLEVLEFGILR